MNNTTSTESQPSGINQANAIVFPIFTALAIIIVYMPACDFFRKRNFAMCSMIAAVTLMNLYGLVNSLIWRNDDFDTWWNGEGLCDIEVNTRYQLSVVLLTSMACFTKNLADVFNTDTYSFRETSSMKRRKLIYDILFCWGVPVFQVGIHYVVSVGRYSIEPIWGCADGLDNSWPFIVFYYIPNPIFTLLSGYYAVRMLIGLHKHRSNISSTLASSGSGMSTRYFVKLAIIACSLIIIWVPCEGYWLYRQLLYPFHAYNWKAIHDPASWNPIEFIPTSDDPFMQYNGWPTVALSILIFCYFGFNNDAIDKYCSWLVVVGFGLIWPSLKEPRAQRQRQGSTTGSQISSHFDLVSKAMHCFTPSRKNSQIPGSTGPSEGPSEMTQSRKASLATFEHHSLAQINSRTALTPESFANSALQDVDTISSAPHMTPDPLLIRSATPPSIVPTAPKRNFLTSFLAHINLPFPFLFSHRTQPSPPLQPTTLTPTALRAIDLEAQEPRSHPLPSPITPHSTVSTNIWSEVEGPDSPKMGTRAYRERKRREMELEAVEEERGRAVEEEGVVIEKKVERRESSAEIGRGSG